MEMFKENCRSGLTAHLGKVMAAAAALEFESQILCHPFELFLVAAVAQGIERPFPRRRVVGSIPACGSK